MMRQVVARVPIPPLPTRRATGTAATGAARARVRARASRGDMRGEIDLLNVLLRLVATALTRLAYVIILVLAPLYLLLVLVGGGERQLDIDRDRLALTR